MENESYVMNQGHFSEALKTYGCIPTSFTSLTDSDLPGALDFKQYYLSNGDIATLTAIDR